MIIRKVQDSSRQDCSHSNKKKIDEIDSAIYVRDHHLIIPLTITENEEVTLGYEEVSLRKTFDKICNLVQYYEVKEATSLVELALWKFKIEQASGLDRDACRIGLPGPAKDLILKYAFTIPLHTTTYIQIYVDCSRGVNLASYDVEPTHTIADFKKNIRDDKGIPVDQQNLSFNGELLHDDCTLSECNIVMDSTIDLVVIGD